MTNGNQVPVIQLESEYEKHIGSPIQMVIADYDNVVDVAIQATQEADRFRREWARSERQNQKFRKELDDVTCKYESSTAKHKIARSHFQKELRELNKFREQRDNFYEIIQLCKDLMCNEDIQRYNFPMSTEEDNSSEVSSGLRHRLSVAQVNRLKQFKMEDLLDEDSDEENMNHSRMKNKHRSQGKLAPFVTPRQGRPLQPINEQSGIGDITFDEPVSDDEPDAQSTRIMSPVTTRHHPYKTPNRNFKRYSSDAILGHSTLSTGESSVAAGMDAGLYQAKKNVASNGTRRRPSNQFRRRSQIGVIEEASVPKTMKDSPKKPVKPIKPVKTVHIQQPESDSTSFWTTGAPSDHSTPAIKRKNYDHKSYEQNNHTPTRIAPDVPSKKAKVTPPDSQKPPMGVAVTATPVSLKDIQNIKQNMRKRHEWVHKTGIISGPKCAISARKIKFNKAMWRCARCGMIVHPDAFDQAVKTECHAALLKSACSKNDLLKKQVSQEFVANFTQRQHNIFLVVEEVERRRAIVCEGLYRVNGNVKEQNMMIQKIKEAKHSLRLRRQILATQCKDHNTLCSIMKFYLREGEPLLTYKLLPAVCVIAENAQISTQEREKQLSNIIEQLPTSNQQVLSCVLRHLNHVIENRQVNKMSDESIARSIGPSLIGYKNPQPTAKDYQTAHHYQRSIMLGLLHLPNVGSDCVLGRALKQLQEAQKSYPVNGRGGQDTPPSATPNTLRKLFGKS